MSLPKSLRGKLRLPAVGAPLFIISHPALVIAQCKAGIVAYALSFVIFVEIRGRSGATH